MSVRWMFLPALLGGWLCAAAAADFPDLPPPAAVAAALAEHPSVRAAQAGIRAEEAGLDRQVAGPYETSVRLIGQQRKVGDIDRRYNEWAVGLERPLRLPGKARLDEQLGREGVSQAQLAHGDAMHEASRALLKGWFAWQREAAQARQWQAQADVLGQQAEAVAKRLRAGDASRMEQTLAQAALAQAEASAAQSRGRERAAAAEFAVGFPRIALPAQPQVADPQAPPADQRHWAEQILAHSHELGVARAEARRARLSAARAEADRLPDPTAGIHYGSEFAGNERILGVSLSIPFSGAARSAEARQAQARADATADREAAALRKIEAEVALAYNLSRSAYDNWQNLHAAAEQFERGAAMSARAYALGEGGLTDVLTARRQAIEARLAATVARIDAAEARYRLMLDAHQLWPMHHEDDESGGGASAAASETAIR
jgi:outer membrane protein TolC